MLQTMFATEVGDDVFGEDPSVNLLESEVAAYFGMEAALFCPSGTMTNQIAIKCHTQPGDEVLCEKKSHVYIYEGGGIAFNSGAQVQVIEGNAGCIAASQIPSHINPDDVHKARTSLVCLENTSNRGGGTCYDLDEIKNIRALCDQYQLSLHLDGARVWNAIVANQENPIHYGSLFHSISVCFSKGLGAPVGSALIGTHEFIRKARRIRKVLGGGMRQAGYLAAAANFAMNHHIDRLTIDHAHCKQLASALASHPWVEKIDTPQTNILIFKTHSEKNNLLKAFFESHHIYVMAISSSEIRMVTHLDISESMIHYVIEKIKEHKQSLTS